MSDTFGSWSDLTKKYFAENTGVITQIIAKSGKATLANVRHYSGECVTPPDGTTAAVWIKAGFPGAQWPKLLVEWLETLSKP